MTSSQTTLPRWDLTVLYPGLESSEFAADFARITGSIGDLVALFDHHQIEQGVQQELDGAVSAAFETIVTRYNEVLDQSITLSNYLLNIIATDSRNQLAQGRMSELRPSLASLEQIEGRFAAWVGSLDLDALFERSTLAREHRYPLERMQQRARRLMSSTEEALASELGVSGAKAWKQLYTNLTSQLTVAIERDGQSVRVPMSAIRNDGYDADHEVRRRSHEAELAAWRDAAVPLAAALNGVKGEVIVLCRRRGWASPLDESLFVSGIDRATLDAMFAAAREALPDVQRYFRAKARALGIERLAWYDLFAPVGSDATVWDYATATGFIAKQFGTYSDELRDFAIRAFNENWIDAEPRPGKRGGAYSERLRPGESRILTNYKPTFHGMTIIAHELGHAYHTLQLGKRTALQSQTPETLAETASIFCETLVHEAALHEATKREQLALLDSILQSSAQRVASVLSRFTFEQRLFEQRQQREVSVEELCSLMEQAQRESYGDGLDPHELHPYLWAAKVHYFYPNLSFYNYPYLFGSLFSPGLYAQYQRDPERFKASYDALLSSTGLADAATLAARFGFDLRSPDFWRSSLNIIRANIERFEQLV